MKKDKYNKIIRENQEILEDLSSLLKEEKCFEESNHLKDYLTNNENRQNFNEILDEMESFDELVKKVNARNKALDKERLLEQLNEASSRRALNRRHFITSVTVAAAVLLVSLIVWSRKEGESETKRSVVTETILKPTLILDDGKVISLTETTKDTIQQLKVMIGNIDNKLCYTLKDTLSTGEKVALDSLVFNTLVVPTKYNYKIRLCDGTEVFLNAGSRIKYPEAFGTTQREVILEGEAYFKVHKEERPFIVRAGDVSVRVYGTEFNVNHVSSMKLVETVLAKGSVGVSKTGGPQEMMMTPNQKLLFENNNFNLKEVDAQDYSSWTEGLFRYKKQPLKRVLNDLSLWYGTRFIVNCDIEEVTVTLTAKRTDSADKIIDFIGTIIEKVIIKEGKEVYTIEEK